MLVAILGDGSEPASDAIAITSQKGNTVVFNAENYYDVAVNFYDVGGSTSYTVQCYHEFSKVTSSSR
jgi:hypothetical protein